MNLFTGEASDAYFGGDVSPTVRQLLQQAAEAGPDQRAALLWTAQATAPTQLAVYYALYKHHAGRREFELAERAAQRGLAEAARQAGWPTGEPLAGTDFQAEGPARFWLFTLKALGFIALRSGRVAEARTRLERLAALGASARVGDEVTAALLQAVSEAESGQRSGFRP